MFRGLRWHFASLILNLAFCLMGGAMASVWEDERETTKKQEITSVLKLVEEASWCRAAVRAYRCRWAGRRWRSSSGGLYSAARGLHSSACSCSPSLRAKQQQAGSAVREASTQTFLLQSGFARVQHLQKKISKETKDKVFSGLRGRVIKCLEISYFYILQCFPPKFSST